MADGAHFWTQLARTISRPAMSEDAELLTAIQDDRLNITFELSGDAGAANGANGGGLDYLQVDGTVYKPDGTSAPVHLRQGAPGRYEASIDATLAGNYIVALNPRQGNRQLAPAIGGANRSTSPEFRRYTSNLGLLDEIVEATNGRRLDISDPTKASLFDRTGMPPSVSSLPAWHTILLWSLALLLLDVACRRIAWDYNLLRSAAVRAIEKVTPASVRGSQAAATLATLRRVSDEVDGRQEADAVGVVKFKTTGRIAPPPDREIAPLNPENAPDPAARFDGESLANKKPAPVRDASQITAALDALMGRTKPGAPQSSASSPKPNPADESNLNPAETTGSLLAAKRRARQRLDGPASSDQT